MTIFEDSNGVRQAFMLLCCHLYLFYKVNAILEIHAKVNECPFDAFALVLLLFQHKHVMVKELLKFLVGEVNAELFKTVELQGRNVKLGVR